MGEGEDKEDKQDKQEKEEVRGRCMKEHGKNNTHTNTNKQLKQERERVTPTSLHTKV